MSFDVALYTVKLKTRLNPHSSKHDSRNLAMTLPVWLITLVKIINLSVQLPSNHYCSNEVSNTYNFDFEVKSMYQ